MYGHIYTRHNTTKKNWHVMIKTKKEKTIIFIKLKIPKNI